MVEYDPCSEKGTQYLRFLDGSIAALERYFSDDKFSRRQDSMGHAVKVSNRLQKGENLADLKIQREELLRQRSSAGC